jgi:hypothetical protein
VDSQIIKLKVKIYKFLKNINRHGGRRSRERKEIKGNKERMEEN